MKPVIKHKRVYFTLLVLITQLLLVTCGCTINKQQQNEGQTSSNYYSIDGSDKVVKVENKVASLQPELSEYFNWDRMTVENEFSDFNNTYFNSFLRYPDLGISFRFNEAHNESLNDFLIGETAFVGNVNAIVLGKEYKEDVLPEITLGMPIYSVTEILGSANFQESELDIYGYRFTDFYIFFIGSAYIDEVAIYPNYNVDLENYISYIDTFIYSDSKPKDIIMMEIINYLTEKLPDYSYAFTAGYKYSSRYQKMGLGYLNHGFCMSYDYLKDELNFTVYGKWLTKKSVDIEWITFYPDSDLIYQWEKDRVSFTIDEDAVTSPDRLKIVQPNADQNLSRLYAGFFVIYLNNPENNIEVYTGWGVETNQFYWLDNRYIVVGGNWVRVQVFDTVKLSLVDVLPEGILMDGFTVDEVKKNILCFRADRLESSESQLYQVKYEISENGEITFYGEFI